MQTFMYNNWPYHVTSIVLATIIVATQTFSKDKVMEPIISLISICLQDNIGEQGITFFDNGQKPIFTLN